MQLPRVLPVLRSTTVVAALAVVAASCANDARPPTSGAQGFLGLRGAAPVVMVSDRSCDAVLENFQTFAPEVLANQFVTFDEEVAMDDTGGSAVAGGAAAPPADGAASEGARDLAASGDASGGGGAVTSDTNTQEAGIDEPDVVETDGDHVYLVDQQDLLVLDGATGEVVGRLPLGTYGGQLLLHDDRLLVISGGGYAYASDGVEPIMVDPPRGDIGQATPGETEILPAPDELAPDPATSGPAPEPGVTEPAPDPLVDPEPRPIAPPAFNAGTVIQLVDVSDAAEPVLVESTEVEGYHVSTRVVAGVARVVVSGHPEVQPMMRGSDGGGSVGEASLDAAVASTTIGDWLPSFRTTTATDSSEGSLVACEDVFMPEVNAGLAETSVLRFDFEAGFDPADTTTVVADVSTVYASASTLYLAATRYVAPGQESQVDRESWSTALQVFDLGGDGAAAHIGSGEIPGQLLNQYSLSEFDGHLRVATTEGTPWEDGSQPSESSVRVLSLEGGQLVQVGAVSGLGLTETIQSVRFMGPVGYVVTFRQTDPLYVVDLADPAAPVVVGELKIPGFSSYLHPIGDGRLVGIGRDADSLGRDRGFLLSLFDVSDPTAPRQLQTLTEADAWSGAGFDPKSFLWWGPESVVAVPIERYHQVDEPVEPGSDPADAGITSEPDFENGIAVFDVSDDGITERTTVSVDGRYPSRALVVQGRLWSLFDGGVAVGDFASLGSSTFHPYR